MDEVTIGMAMAIRDRLREIIEDEGDFQQFCLSEGIADVVAATKHGLPWMIHKLGPHHYEVTTVKSWGEM